MVTSEVLNETAQKVMEAAVPDKKTRAGKTAAKKVVDSAVAEVENAVETVKKVRASRSVAPVVYVQYGEAEYDVNAVVEAVKADYSNNGGSAVKELRVYIKPEDGAAYYVVNGSEGKIDL